MSPSSSRDSTESGPERSPALLLAASQRGRWVVVQASQTAWHAGVRAGMTVAHARALLPGDAVVAGHDPQREQAVLLALARWANRFTPTVQVDSPDGLLLEITGCEHLFGGTAAMLQQVVGQTRALGFAARGAIGPTAGCAWALARHGGGPGDGLIAASPAQVPGMLAPLPVAALRIDEQTQAALATVAVRTVGDLLRLPRRSLAARFGPLLLQRVDQALGHAFEPIEPLRPTEPMRVQQVFAGPVLQLEAILQTGQALVTALCAQLAQRETGVRQLHLAIERIDADRLHEMVMLTEPSCQARHLWALLRPRLERVHMGFGIEAMTLTATAVGRLAHRQADHADWSMQPGRQDAAQQRAAMGQLVDRLVGRFGPDRVLTAHPQATYVPERAFVYQSATRQAALHDVASRDEPQAMQADRPTQLLRRPIRAEVMLLWPDGPVMAMRLAGQHVRIVTCLGPERITPRWWLVGDDQHKPRSRDYYKLQDEHGRWWWAYRQTGTSVWYVQGRWC